MRPNIKVTYSQLRIYKDDCLLVDNYQPDNEVWHLPIEYKDIDEYKTRRSVGVWRVKPTDK